MRINSAQPSIDELTITNNITTFDYHDYATSRLIGLTIDFLRTSIEIQNINALLPVTFALSVLFPDAISPLLPQMLPIFIDGRSKSRPNVNYSEVAMLHLIYPNEPEFNLTDEMLAAIEEAFLYEVSTQEGTWASAFSLKVFAPDRESFAVNPAMFSLLQEDIETISNNFTFDSKGIWILHALVAMPDWVMPAFSQPNIINYLEDGLTHITDTNFYTVFWLQLLILTMLQNRIQLGNDGKLPVNQVASSDVSNSLPAIINY